jgi:hypothetical protein
MGDAANNDTRTQIAKSALPALGHGRRNSKNSIESDENRDLAQQEQEQEQPQSQRDFGPDIAATEAEYVRSMREAITAKEAEHVRSMREALAAKEAEHANALFDARVEMHAQHAAAVKLVSKQLDHLEEKCRVQCETEETLRSKIYGKELDLMQMKRELALASAQ